MLPEIVLEMKMRRTLCSQGRRRASVLRDEMLPEMGEENFCF